LSVNGTDICAFVAKNKVGCVTDKDKTYKSGFVSIGSSWDYVQFDNFATTSSPYTCGVGDYARLDICDVKQNNQVWTVNTADSSIRLRSDKTKCLTVSGKDPASGSPAVRVLTCNSTLTADQLWKVSDNQVINNSGQCLDLTNQKNSQCTNIEVYYCNKGTNQAWTYTESTGLINTLSAENMCLAATL